MNEQKKEKLKDRLRVLICVGRRCGECKINDANMKYDGYCSRVPFETYLKYACELYQSGDEAIMETIEEMKEEGQIVRYAEAISMIGGVRYD